MFATKPTNAPKSTNVTVIPMDAASEGKREAMEFRQKLDKTLAEATAAAIAHRADLNAALNDKNHFMGLYHDSDQMHRETIKSHNDINLMSSQVKLSLSTNITKLVASIEAARLEATIQQNKISDLEARLQLEVEQHALTRGERDRLAYSKVPFFKRIGLAAAGRIE